MSGFVVEPDDDRSFIMRGRLDVEMDGSSSDESMVLDAGRESAIGVCVDDDGESAIEGSSSDGSLALGREAHGRGPSGRQPHGRAPHGREPIVVEDLNFSFTWAVRLVVVLRNFFPDDTLSTLFQTPRKVSTHFSGIGTVELAVSMLAAAMAHVLRFSWPIKFIFGCEANAACRAALSWRNSGACIFEDIWDRFSCEVVRAAKGEAEPPATWKKLQKAEMFNGAQCSVHRSTCAPGAVDADMSGSPCIPWSRANRGKLPKGRRHPMAKLLLTWCRWLRSALPKVAVHENVKGFDCSYLDELVGDLYHIFNVTMTPADFGYAFIRRPRWYSILVLRQKVERPTCPIALYDRIKSAMSYQVERSSVAWVVRATESEVLEYENAQRLGRGLSALDSPSGDWRYLLTAQQVERLCRYEARDGRTPTERSALQEGWIADLGQRPEWSCSRHDALPTLRRNSARLWIASQRRWLLPVEMAAAMGFPVHADLAVAARVPRTDITTLGPAQSMGNAMHVANAGGAFVLAWLATLPA